MVYRPVDENGDILPVLSASDLLSGAEAVTQLVRDRLELLSGDWWENPAWGNEILLMMQESRLSEADQQTVAAYVTSYIRETPGVQEVNDVTYSMGTDRNFSYQCTVVTGDGYAKVTYEI